MGNGTTNMVSLWNVWDRLRDTIRLAENSVVGQHRFIRSRATYYDDNNMISPGYISGDHAHPYTLLFASCVASSSTAWKSEILKWLVRYMPVVK